jgi:hypothetical protein
MGNSHSSDILEMHHYRCQNCSYTWYTTLETNRCADPMCLKYNIISINEPTKRDFEFWTLGEIEADAERARFESSRQLTENLSKIIQWEQENIKDE